MLLSFVPTSDSILPPGPNGNSCALALAPQHFHEMIGLGLRNAVRMKAGRCHGFPVTRKPRYKAGLSRIAILLRWIRLSRRASGLCVSAPDQSDGQGAGKCSDP
jgi:hypothetical protein